MFSIVFWFAYYMLRMFFGDLANSGLEWWFPSRRELANGFDFYISLSFFIHFSFFGD
jgi:hypothetical protein